MSRAPIRLMIKGFRGRFGAVNSSWAGLIDYQMGAYQQSLVLVKGFYALLTLVSLNQIVGFAGQWQNPETLDPLWPLAWINLVDPLLGLWGMVLTACAAFVLGLAFVERRISRIGIFFFFFQIAALVNSFGKINHNLHGMVIIALFLIALPDGNWKARGRSMTQRHLYLTVFLSCQAAFMLFYTLAGLWKVYAGVVQIAAGDLYHTFHPFAFAQHIAFRLLQTNSQSFLGELIVNRPWLGTLPFLLALYLELFALTAAFRPQLHKLWGIFLIAFHIGTWLIMTISFNLNIALLGLFMVFSPLHPDVLTLQQVLINLPLISWMIPTQRKRQPQTKAKLSA